jgi:hypothetical protein
VKSIINVNTANTVTRRSGTDIPVMKKRLAQRLNFKENTFFTGQLIGEHNLLNQLKLNGMELLISLTDILPDQRRILYSQSSNRKILTDLLFPIHFLSKAAAAFIKT